MGMKLHRACLVVALATTGWLSTHLLATAQILPVSAPTAADRDRLYAELASEAEAIERTNVLKKAVRLVKPTVVHIDADKIEDDGLRRRRVQEAGSGVVVDIAGQNYILTNRHVINATPLDQIKI